MLRLPAHAAVGRDPASLHSSRRDHASVRDSGDFAHGSGISAAGPHGSMISAAERAWCHHA
ncbi:MAG: hypothetical protein LBE67_09005 [Kocuria palustris]|nr:hypothetical protein [Kocuria palustris]